MPESRRVETENERGSQVVNDITTCKCETLFLKEKHTKIKSKVVNFQYVAILKRCLKYLRTKL